MWIERALRYVLLNARLHAARTARKALRAIDSVLDPASSARWFDGWKIGSMAAPSTHERSASANAPPVARARTWLLRVGWRRYGLIDPADVPA